MSDGMRDEYFKYLDDLVAEMYELFEKHQELEEQYSSAMQHLQNMDWVRDYADHVQTSGRSGSVGDSSD